MKTIGKLLLALIAVAVAALSVYLLEEKRAPRYIDIYSNYKEDDE